MVKTLPFNAGVLAQALVRELGSHLPCGQNNQNIKQKLRENLKKQQEENSSLHIRLTADIPSETLEASSASKTCQPRILYSAKLFFKNKDISK